MDSTQLKNLAKKLEDLGMRDKEAQIYVATLFLGSASVQKIATQAGVKRATTYVILEQLEKMGLVSESTEGKKTVYVGENPQALMRWLENKEKEIANKKEGAKNLLSELEASQRGEASEAPQVRFYRGLEGISTILAEAVRKAKPKTHVYGVSNADEVEKLFPDSWQKFPKNLVNKKIHSKLLYWSSDKEIPSSSKILRQTQKLDKPPQADISLTEDVAAILAYRGKESVGVVIESKEIVGALRQLFEMAWKNNDNNKK